jgi:crotonobetainyl-CoA:carnitine CoA-transferase CaiB-like acyl-CoA transferase
VQNYLVSGVAAPRRGNGGFGGIPSQAFACADSEIFVVASTPNQWAGLARALGRPELASDPRFATVSARIANRDAVLAVLDEIFAQRNAEYWIARLEAEDVPVSPVNGMDGVFANPQLQHRGIRRSARVDDNRTVDLVANPIRFSDTPIDSYTAPPSLGQHTEEILRAVLGKSDDDIRKLHACSAI